MSQGAPSIGLLVNPSAKAQRSAPAVMRRLQTLMEGRGLYAQSASIDELESIAVSLRQVGCSLDRLEVLEYVLPGLVEAWNIYTG